MGDMADLIADMAELYDAFSETEEEDSVVKCNHCGKKIYFEIENGKHVPFTLKNNTRHLCRSIANPKEFPLL